MTREIKTVTVVGAGAMGSGIAAHLANAGIKVHLVDIVPKDAKDRNVIAKGAIDRMKKANLATDPLSAGFMDPDNAKRIIPGNIEDDLEKAVQASDWVIEVALEDLKIKHILFEKIDNFRRPGTIVTSNTSTIPLHDLVEGRSADFKSHFANTHFFNPPRIMKLLELISGPDTDPAVTQTLKDFCDIRLGKTVIECNDTPAFIANRIGTYFMFKSISETIARGIPLDQSDAVLSKPVGLGKDGTFAVLDLVGIGLAPHLTDSLNRTLADDDAFRDIDSGPTKALLDDLLKSGRTGRRAANDAGGFYRMLKNEDGGKVKQAVNLDGEGYHDVPKRSSLASVKAGKKGPRAVFEAGDEGADLAWAVMRDTLIYAASLVPSVSDNIADIDTAMKAGFNWQYGPFELLDKIGLEWFVDRALKDGATLPPVLELADGHPFYVVKPDGKTHHMTFDFAGRGTGYAPQPERAGVVSLEEVKRTSKPLVTHNSASLWDVGDGVVCFEVHSKANTMDPSVFHVLNESLKLVGDGKGKYKAMVVYNDGENFSVGANIGILDTKLKLAEGPLSFYNDMATPAILKALHVPKAAAETLQKAIRPVCRLLDKAYVTLTGHRAEKEAYRVAEDMVFQGQALYKALREAPFPVVGAPFGYAFGGGCEILLHCDAIQAHAETYMGLVEAGVGFIPGWGGCVRSLERAFNAQQAGYLKNGPLSAVSTVFRALANPMASTSNSAQDARKKLWLRPQDGITMNRDRLLADAKEKALSLAPGYTPPQPALFRLPGTDGEAALRSAIDSFYGGGQMTHHDVVVTDALGSTLAGGDTHPGRTVTENDMLQRERENFMSLLHTAGTRARVSYMIATNKPLREAPLSTPQSLDDIRAVRTPANLDRRDPTGKPLEGADAARLKDMAEDTARFYRQLRKLGMA